MAFGALLVAAIATPSFAEDRTTQPEEDDFSQTPYTEYGEFNFDDEEAADTRFFQFGRFFGVSLGLNYEGVTGNRGKLWQGGFPGFDARFHYWFDFNFALDIGLFTASHYYDAPVRGGKNDVNVTFMGINLKYYFDTRNLSSGVTFAGPYLIVGAGSYAKSESPPDRTDLTSKDAKFGVSTGAGLEFAIAPRKTYFTLEGKVHFVKWADHESARFANPADGGLEDLHGMLYTFTASVLFTW